MISAAGAAGVRRPAAGAVIRAVRSAACRICSTSARTGAAGSSAGKRSRRSPAPRSSGCWPRGPRRLPGAPPPPGGAPRSACPAAAGCSVTSSAAMLTPADPAVGAEQRHQVATQIRSTPGWAAVTPLDLEAVHRLPVRETRRRGSSSSARSRRDSRTVRPSSASTGTPMISASVVDADVAELGIEDAQADRGRAVDGLDLGQPRLAPAPRCAGAPPLPLALGDIAQDPGARAGQRAVAAGATLMRK